MQQRTFVAVFVAIAISLLITGLCSATEFQDHVQYSVLFDERLHKWSVQHGKHSQAVAWGFKTDRALNQTGWAVLDITSSPHFGDEYQAFAAGFLEGALQHELIWTYWNDYKRYVLDDQYNEQLEEWIAENDHWMHTNIRQMDSLPSAEKEHWNQVVLVLMQLQGLHQGYTQYAPKEHPISFLQFVMFQLDGDVADLYSIFASKNVTNENIRFKDQVDSITEMKYSRTFLSKPSATEKPEYLSIFDTRCSALIKLAQDNQKIFVGHTTWDTFSSMLRVYKHFNLQFRSSKSKRVSFSSNPGWLVSVDDWYITDQELVITETTNGFFNLSLYDYTTPQSLLYWIRNIVANRMATSGREWADIFAKYNSGTYSNQWMIIDSKRFQPGAAKLQSGVLTIAEQIPGYVEIADMSDVLSKKGYWSSYNIPYFPNIYNISGFAEYAAKYGNDYSYQMCPRARIFNRDAPHINSIEDMKNMLRYNQWQSDPFSNGNACWGIAARCDMNPESSKYSRAFGGIDSKVIDAAQLKHRMAVEAISGPTYVGQPPFQWTERWADTIHSGQPESFKFPWLTMAPKA